MEPLFIGRQAILDRRLRTYGYELLFRRSELNAANVVDHDSATASVVLNAFVELGLDTVVGNRLAFVNASRGFLLSGYAWQLPHERVVIEVLEDVPADEEVTEAVAALARRGYRIALDDYTEADAHAPLVPLATMVKIDLSRLSPADVEAHVQRLRDVARRIELVAERIETSDELDRCRALGFDYFQGHFLGRPVVSRSQRPPAQRLGALRVLALLNDPAAQLADIEAAIGQDVVLGYKLLRVVNSACFGLVGRVESLRQAVVLLGRDRIRSWVSLAILSGMTSKPDELVRMALIRARMCEALGERLDPARAPTFFTVGLLSAMDAILDAPMATALDSLPLAPDLNVALVDHTGPLGEALAAVLAYERGAWEDVHCASLSAPDFVRAFFDAVRWSTTLDVELARAAS